MPKYLSIEQKRLLAGRIWQYLKKADDSKAVLLTSFVERFGRNETYMAQKLDGAITLSEIESNWIIRNSRKMLEDRDLQEFFEELFQASPQEFGFYTLDLFSLTSYEVFKIGIGKVVRMKKKAIESRVYT